jgi:hypothetical protein
MLPNRIGQLNQELLQFDVLFFIHLTILSVKPGKEVLVPFPTDGMRTWPISPRVNSPRNNDPDLLEPIEV